MATGGCMCGGCTQCLSDQGFAKEDFEENNRIDLRECMHDPKDVKKHMDHAEFLEVATYGLPGEKPVAVTVECTKCGCVVQELYDAGWEDPPDAEVP